jgi:hypothetical protein
VTRESARQNANLTRNEGPLPRAFVLLSDIYAYEFPLISWLIDRVDRCCSVVVMTDQAYSASGSAARACFPAAVDSAGFAES